MPSLAAGGRARITGLTKRADLNGREVTLLQWSEEDARWAGLCDDGEGILVRIPNLVPVSAADSEAVAAAAAMVEAVDTPTGVSETGHSAPPVAEAVDNLAPAPAKAPQWMCGLAGLLGHFCPLEPKEAPSEVPIAKLALPSADATPVTGTGA